MAGYEYLGGETIDSGDGVTLHIPPQESDNIQAEPVVQHPTVRSAVSSAGISVNSLADKSPKVRHQPPVHEPILPTFGRRVDQAAVNREDLLQNNKVVAPSATPILNSPEQTSAPSATPIEKTPRTNGFSRTVKVAGALLALTGVAGGAAWVFDHIAAESSTTHALPKVSEDLIPPLSSNESDADGDIVPDSSETNPLLVPVIPTEQPTIPAKKSSPVKMQQKSRPAPTVSPKVIVPSVTSTTPVTMTPSPTAPNTAPRPSATTTEQTSDFPTVPSETSLQLLSDAANEQRAEELKNHYPDIANYLQAVQSGELSYLSKNTISSYQNGPLKTTYNNMAAHIVLGEPELLNEQALRSTRNPAGIVVSFTDNALRSANEVYPLVGGDISKVAYLNEDLSNELTNRLGAGENVQVSKSHDEEIIGKVENINGAMVVPVVARYNKDSGPYDIFRWEALVPIKWDGSFVAVTVFEKQLNQADTTIMTTPPAPEITPTSPPTDRQPDNNKNNHQKDHSHKHWWDKLRD
jgi:hypothetical protein